MARMTLTFQMCSSSLMARHPRSTRQYRHPRGTRQYRHPRGTRQHRHPRATRQGPHPQVDRQQHPPTFLQIPTQLESTICRSGPILTLNKISKSWRTELSLSRSSR